MFSLCVCCLCLQMAGLPHSVVARAATIADQMQSRLEPAAAAAATAAGNAGADADGEAMQINTSSEGISVVDAAVLQALQQMLQQLGAARATAQQQQQQQGPSLSASLLEQLQTVQRDAARLLGST
jgi:hypothetical protein